MSVFQKLLRLNPALSIARSIVAVWVLSAVAGSAAADTRKDPTTYVFGIVPQQSATRLAQEWIPLLKHLGEQAGIRLSFATAKDIPTFEACLAQGIYDIAYMNPYHYTVFHAAPGYQAFARQSGKQLKGIVVARKDGNIASLGDLQNLGVAFPSPAAFGASVIPRAELRAAGIDIEPRYVNSHDSVYRAVAAGLAPAGGGVSRTFQSIDERIRNQLKIIYQTKEYTPHAFAAHARVAQADLKALAAAMLNVSKSAPQLLQPLGMKGFQAAADHDWDDIRALKLTRAQTEISTMAVTWCRSG